VRLASLLRFMPGLRSLHIEVGAHLPVLGILRRQLTDTASEAERAVVAVCENFRHIAESAKQAVARSGEMLDSNRGDSGGQFQELLGTARTTIGHLLDRMEATGEVSLRLVERMEQVESAMRQVVRQLSEVDKIAFVNKLLALNAAIQAVHVGEAGRAFGVVADEISVHARRSSEITESIGQTVRGLSTAVLAAAHELSELALHDRETLATSRAEVESTLRTFREMHDSMVGIIEESRQVSGRLGEDIARSIVTLQFQDRVSQRIGHVVQALESMENAFGGTHQGLSAGVATRYREVLADLQGSYTMASERSSSGESASPTATAPEDADVELF
jgi:methyl-accepting chemotaxis protein